MSGEIAKIGKDVTEFREGQKVTIEPQVYCGECYPCRHGKYNLFVKNSKLWDFRQQEQLLNILQ